MAVRWRELKQFDFPRASNIDDDFFLKVFYLLYICIKCPFHTYFQNHPFLVFLSLWAHVLLKSCAVTIFLFFYKLSLLWGFLIFQWFKLPNFSNSPKMSITFTTASLISTSGVPVSSLNSAHAEFDKYALPPKKHEYSICSNYTFSWYPGLTLLNSIW